MTPKPKAKDRILAAFLKKVPIKAGPFSMEAPAIVIVPVVLAALVASCFLARLWLLTPEPVRNHKIHEVRGALK